MPTSKTSEERLGGVVEQLKAAGARSSAVNDRLLQLATRVEVLIESDRASASKDTRLYTTVADVLERAVDALENTCSVLSVALIKDGV